jgi:hypothetical protein
MSIFAGIEFPTLPTGTLQCSNKHFLNDYNTTGASNVTAFYEAASKYSDLSAEINYKLNNDDSYTWQDGINDLNAYRNYLNAGLTTLGNEGTSGSNVGGFTGWYWTLRENTGWFGIANSDSCDKNRSWCEDRHATGQSIRATYWAKFANSANLIEQFETAQAESLEVADIQSQLDALANQNAEDDAVTNKNITDLKNAQFATYVEMFAIAGAVLILAFTAYKTLKNKL